MENIYLNKRGLSFYFVLTLLFSLCGCKHDKDLPKPTISATQPPLQPTVIGCGDLSNVSFSRLITPIINLKCVGCHDASAGIKLNNYDNVILSVESGQLYGCLTNDPNFLQMPPSGKLDSCSIKSITNWINQGHPNN